MPAQANAVRQVRTNALARRYFSSQSRTHTMPPLRLLGNNESHEPSPPAKPAGPRESLFANALTDDSRAELSASLEDVVRRFGNFMRRTAHRHKLGASEIDEVMQEARIRLWKALGTSEKIQRAPASYIYRTVSSAALDFLRRRKVRREDSLDDATQFDNADFAHQRETDEPVRIAELQALVLRAVGLLVESRRAVVRMYLAGYDREEIQDVLGWSEAKTRNLLYRGLADVRESLLSWGVGPGGVR